MLQVFVFLFHRFTLLLRDRIGHVFAAALDENVSLIPLVLGFLSLDNLDLPKGSYLQCILAREAFIAMMAGERLHGQMDPFMSFQVVVPVETLRTLVALEGSVVCRTRWVARVGGMTPIHLLHGQLAAVERQPAGERIADERHMSVRIVHVRQHGSVHRR